MDRASSLIYPGSRTLAGWWRQLAPYQPHAFWVGYGYVHRIEASLRVLAARPLEPFAGLILQALDLEPAAPGARSADLCERLRLPEVIVQRVLSGLLESDLVARPTPETWQPTDAGRHALTARHYPQRASERRVLAFVERLNAAGQRVAAPHFVPLAECVGVPWHVDPQHRFDAGALEACIGANAEWKESHAFPGDVEGVPDTAALEAWQRVIVDRPERVMLVFTRAGKDADKLLAFAVKVDGWTLHDQAPALRLPASARLLWPELAQETPPALWQDAWRSWCRERQLPNSEVESCALTCAPPRIEVQAPPRLLQRLQAAKSDLLKGDAWLLVGDGFIRAAGQLVIRQNA